jgi:prepilin-type processing-associated H-X9-DG protein
VTAADLDPDPATVISSHTRLDWVGRNHGRQEGYPDERRSNFLYVDGHVESKTIYETLSPFQWGQKFYSLDPNNDLQLP